jgi:hypothetical protein
LTHWTADHLDDRRVDTPGGRSAGSPFRQCPASTWTSLPADIGPNRPAAYRGLAVYSVLPWNGQTLWAGSTDDWDSLPDLSGCSDESGTGYKPGKGGNVSFGHGNRNLFETSYIDSMNVNRPCSRLNRYAAGMCLAGKSNGLEKISLQDRRGGMTTFIACGSPGGE